MEHSTQIINGVLHSNLLLLEIKDKLEILKRRVHIMPWLVVIVVGDNPASALYVGLKTKKAQEVGIKSTVERFSTSVSEDTLLRTIRQYNENDDVHGIMIQLPLPVHIDARAIMDVINPLKDVDGFTSENIGLMCADRPRFVPCTTLGIIRLLQSVFQNGMSGKKAAVIGRSMIVGKPTVLALLHKNCTVTVLHSHSQNIWEETSKADIVISAVGSPNMVKKHWVKLGACVIDVGVSKVNDKVVGDVDFVDVLDTVGHITPVPGGVGPMTVACLMQNTLLAACIKYDISL